MEEINQNKANETEPFKDKEWISLRLAIKYILILTFIILSSVLITSIFAQGQSTTDVEYTFSDAIIVDNDTLLTNTTQNFINDTIETQHFNASYSFENDASGSIPKGWNDNSVGSASATVINSHEGHNKVVYLDNDTPDDVSFETDAFSRTSGTFEFWILTTDATYNTYMLAFDGGLQAITYLISNDVIRLHNGVGWQTLSIVPRDNTWIHFRIDWNTNSDLTQTYINGIDEGMYAFGNPSGALNTFRLALDNNIDYDSYIDAIGFNWFTNYTIKDNVVPYSYPSNNLTIDKWEFFHNVNGSITEAGQQDIPYFTEVGTLAYIVKNQELCDDETAVYYPIASIVDQGIYRDIDVVSFNTATILTKVIRGGNSASKILYDYFEIYSFDDTLIVRLRIDDTASSGDLKLYYYDGGGYNLLTDIEDGWYNYIFNITIIHGYVNFLLNDTAYTFDIIDSSKTGIGSFKIWSELSGSAPAQTGLFIDYIGVYINQSSIANDFGSYLYPTGKDFKAQNYNLVELNATGYFGLGFNSYEIAGLSLGIFSYTNVSIITFDNIYDLESSLVENAYLIISTNQTDSFNINSIYIHGVNMSDGINDYFPIITSSNVDIDVSYFYLTGNQLRYTMYIDNSSQTEYIQATFELVNILSVNKSFTFKGYGNAIGIGNVWVEYTDTTINLFELNPYTHTENLLLPQNKIIDKLEFRITDDNLDILNGYTATGYITDIEFTYIPNIEVSITTLSLLTVLVPILVLMIPTLIMYGKFGKSAVMPTMMIMSIICFIGALIPAWLFVLMMFGFGAMLIFQLKEGGIV